MIEEVQPHADAVRLADEQRRAAHDRAETVVEFHAFGSPFVRKFRSSRP